MRRHLTTGIALTAIAASALVLSWPALAQDATDATVTEVAASGGTPDEALLTADDLDKMLAPVALYPDTLLTQILYASTFPIDVVKAGRFVDNSADMPDKDRAKAVEATDWDPSVQALAAGFPSVVTRMNDNIDWTEQVGDAVLVQTDDVLDAVQRLRDQAAETGYLTSNDAQTVIVEGDTITIAPANPEVVYVPTYNPEVVYTQAAPAQSVVYVDDGNSDLTDALATGAMIFGTAMILDNIFDNDDPWDNYWRGPPAIDWNDNDFHSRPGINAGGDINIDNSHNNNFTNINRDKVKIDRDKINLDGQRPGLDRPGDGRPGINNDLVGVGRDRPGGLDRDGIDRERDRSFKPDVDKRNEARDKMAARKAGGAAVPTLQPAGERPNRPTVNKPAKGPMTPAVARPAGPKPQINRPANAAKPATANRPASVSRPQGGARPAIKKPPQAASAFERSGGARAGKASNRGRASAGNRTR